MVNIDPITHRAFIADERDSINFYARSMGEWRRLMAITKDDRQRQYYKYFMDVDEIELELANERLEKLRTELTNYERRQRELSAV